MRGDGRARPRRGRRPATIRGSAFGLLAAVQSFRNLAANVIAGLIWTLASPEAAFVYIAAWMLWPWRASPLRAEFAGCPSAPGREARLSLPCAAFSPGVGIAVVWIASPIDLVPDFIPIAGPLDDAVVAALALRHLLRRTDRSVLFEHWRGDPATLEAIVRGRRARQSGN